jgi:hypothetical protein
MKYVYTFRPAGAITDFVYEFSTDIYAPLGLLGILKGPEGRNIVRTGNKKISTAPEERNVRYA